MSIKYYTGRTVSDIVIDALGKTKTNEEFMIVRGILDRFAATDSSITTCEHCTYYQGECCVRFGRQEHPHREPNDFCSKGEPKNDREL